jgi:asparagine synthase (glutamine-hydrolysing)
MCGIVGVVARDPYDVVDAARLRRMRDVITHRGPDGEGLWIERNVGLGHRRLSIIDPARGQQPMSNEDGSVWLVFNGEIYNHAELRPGLEQRGHRYRTRSDSETIIHLYEEIGERVVDHLHGMFAFAIWDRSKRRLLLARDRLGIKPLYVAETERELLFASEIKALLASGAVAAAFRPGALPEFLATRFVSGDETFYCGVRRLMPGHTLTWSPEGGGRERRYWAIPGPHSTTAGPVLSLPREGDLLRDRLQAAVKRHLMSDVPLGVFLSGGIDSSALAAMAAPMVSGALRTFAVGFAETDANELPYARLVAQAIHADHHEVVVSPRDYFEALPKLIWQEDEPIAFSSSVPLYFVSALARDHVKVVLTGEGADELFLGYNRYRVTHWNERLGRSYGRLTPRPIRDRVQRMVASLPPALRRYTRRTFLAMDPDIRTLFCENFAVFPEAQQHRLLARQHRALFDRDPYTPILRAYDEAGGSALDRMSRADLATYLHELLMKQDQMSMAASIESRVPFLDDQIVEYALALPSRLKLRRWQTKAVLRAAVRDLLPAAILTRRKMGFPVPVGRWLREAYWPVTEEFVLSGRTHARRLFDQAMLTQLAYEHRAGVVDHGERLWLLINLEIWFRIFIDGEDPAAIMRPLLGRESRHARSVGQDGRPLAAEHRRPAAQLPAAAGVGAAPSGGARHH